MNLDTPFNIVVLGPPVSGKGTQAQLLATTFDIPHIAAGQMLHAIEHDAHHPMAAVVGDHIKRGDLIPDSIVNEIITLRIKEKDCVSGFVLDGYPRTIEQAHYLMTQVAPTYVFLISLADELIIERMSGRRVCDNGHSWHRKYAPTRVEDICDHCGGTLKVRPDDQVEVVTQRLVTYHQQMEPIFDFFNQRKLLLPINGDQSIEKVFQEMVRYLVTDLRHKIEQQ